MKKFIFIFFLVLTSFSFAEIGDKKYISVPNLFLREKESSFSSKIAPTDYGEEVIVLKEGKKWFCVRKFDGTSGFVPATALSFNKISLKNTENFNYETISMNELALAGKGFGNEEETEYKKSGIGNYDAVDSMERNNVSEDELKEFLVSGDLNLE